MCLCRGWWWWQPCCHLILAAEVWGRNTRDTFMQKLFAVHQSGCSWPGWRGLAKYSAINIWSGELDMKLHNYSMKSVQHFRKQSRGEWIIRFHSVDGWIFNISQNCSSFSSQNNFYLRQKPTTNLSWKPSKWNKKKGGNWRLCGDNLA